MCVLLIVLRSLLFLIAIRYVCFVNDVKLCKVFGGINVHVFC